MSWQNLSVLYCLYICKYKKQIRGASRALHENSLPIWGYITKHIENYHSYPTRKRLVEKFNLDFESIWESGRSLKEIKDELIKEYTKSKVQEMQLNVQELLTDDKEHDIAELLNPINNVYDELTTLEQVKPLMLSQHKKIIDNTLNNVTEKVCNYGFPKLDKSTGGISRKDYILLFANTNVGKSTMARVIATQIALQGKKVLYLTLEETARKSIIKAASLGAKFSATKVFDRKPSIIRERRIEKFQKKLKRAGGDIIFIDKMEHRNVAELHIMNQQFSPDVIILDQLTHFLSNNLKGNKALYEQIYYTSKSLQRYIQQNGTPMIVLHQATRDSKKGDKDEIGLGYGPMQDCDVSLYISEEEELDDGSQWKQLRLTKVRDRKVNVKIDYYWKLGSGILEERSRFDNSQNSIIISGDSYETRN